MCCGNNTVTDKDGRCCAAGHLDACGVCNGDGIVTDLYVAMRTGAVNASRLLLPVPHFSSVTSSSHSVSFHKSIRCP